VARREPKRREVTGTSGDLKSTTRRDTDTELLPSEVTDTDTVDTTDTEVDTAVATEVVTEAVMAVATEDTEDTEVTEDGDGEVTKEEVKEDKEAGDGQSHKSTSTTTHHPSSTRDQSSTITDHQRSSLLHPSTFITDGDGAVPATVTEVSSREVGAGAGKP